MDSATEKPAPYVVAVVLTWKDTEMASRCIRSVFANTYRPFGVVLVDNGSNPPACPVVKRQFPEIETVQLDENHGFTGGCNRGIERALELGARYVFLLNNDTVVRPEAIGHLVNAMESRRDAAMASAILLLPGQEEPVQFYRSVLCRDAAAHFQPGENEPLSEKHAETIETEFAPACAVLFRADALREVGLFDETLFTNWEDYDLCCRFQNAGWKILTVGRAKVTHLHGQTTGRISPFITYLFTRNRLICLFRYGRIWGILRKARLTLRLFISQIAEYGWSNWPAHKAFLRGFLDFLMGVRGKGHVPTDTRDRGRP